MIIRDAKTSYLKDAVSKAKTNPRLAAYMWKCVNNVIGRDKSQRATFPRGISLDIINEFFQSVAITTQHHPAEDYDISLCEDVGKRFMFAKIDYATVLTHLSSLDVGKSTGPDQLSSRFLKEVAGEVIVPLTNLFNYSLQHTVVPLAWKRSHITPLFKGGAPNDPSNYRPIAVVPVVAKILEKIVATQLGTYLEQNNLLHPHQGAYHCRKSTEDILLLAVDYIATLLDRGCVVCGAFIDLRKAFDSLDHYLLLQRISELGVHCQVLEWFKNYLTDRYHRVKAADIFFIMEIDEGWYTPGQCLRPIIIFNLYELTSIPVD